MMLEQVWKIDLPPISIKGTDSIPKMEPGECPGAVTFRFDSNMSNENIQVYRGRGTVNYGQMKKWVCSSSGESPNKKKWYLNGLRRIIRNSNRESRLKMIKRFLNSYIDYS